jgi:hypothetical protein
MQLSTPRRPFFHEPDAQYFASGAWGSTDAKRVLQSPLLANMHRTGQIPPQESSGFATGRMWERIVQAGGRMDGHYVVRPPDMDYRTKAGKEWRDAAQAAGMDILSIDDDSALRRMRDGLLRDHVDLMEQVADAAAFAWQAVVRVIAGEVVLQGKFDILATDLSYSIDIKTTGKPLEMWASDAYRYGYHTQSGWYRHIVKTVTNHRVVPMDFLVTETIPPYRTALLVPDPSWLAYGDGEAARALSLIRACTVAGAWPGGPTTLPLSLPRWISD